MIVIWNEQRIKTVSIIARGVKHKKEVLEKLSGSPRIVLYPGVNEVNDADFTVAREHLENDIKLKRIEILEKRVPGKTEDGKNTTIPEPKTLKDFNAEKCRALIDQVNEPETLKKWKKRETRDEIRNAIQNRMDEIAEFMKQ
jgi:hypothetical protein